MTGKIEYPTIRHLLDRLQASVGRQASGSEVIYRNYWAALQEAPELKSQYDEFINPTSLVRVFEEKGLEDGSVQLSWTTVKTAPIEEEHKRIAFLLTQHIPEDHYGDYEYCSCGFKPTEEEMNSEWIHGDHVMRVIRGE